MPELPDVETFRRRLQRHGLKRKITKVGVNDRRILREVSARRLSSALKGHKLVTTRRHGKHLLARIGGNGWVVFHFGMTGALETGRSSEPQPRFTRIRLEFADRTYLTYTSKRMLGAVRLAEDAEAFIAGHKLGPDALDRRLRPADFAAALAKRRGAVKTALMDQSLLAGMGNIYVDEALFQAHLHPKLLADRLTPKQIKRLYRAMRRALSTAIAHDVGVKNGLKSLPRGYLLRRRSRGAPCPRCGTAISTLRLGGRQTYYCPNCQRRSWTHARKRS